jgi:plasmid stability protein
MPLLPRQDCLKLVVVVDQVIVAVIADLETHPIDRAGEPTVARPHSQTGLQDHDIIPLAATWEVWHMPEILVRGLDQKTVKRLKERARISGRSLQQEVKDILERAATTLTMDEARRLSATWHRLTARS